MNLDHKIIKGIKLVLLSVCLLVGCICANAAEELSDEEKQEVIEILDNTPVDWKKVSISGKFKMQGLPLNPSLKIFMERDSLVVISLRAPFLGEVGRCEITPDSILVVNKMKKTYCKESLEELMRYYPCDITDVQDLLLARVVFPGVGNEIYEDPDLLEMYYQDDQLALVPDESMLLEGFSYGYLMDNYLRPTLLLVVPDENPDLNVTLMYEYLKKGYDIVASYQSPDAYYKATLELDEPIYNSDEISLIKINSKYQRLTPHQFLSSF